MHNFPVPHPNELVYSTVARAGIYHGIISPKQLLDEVFGNRKVIATLDLPCHLQAISNQLENTGRYSVNELVYQHTLFPIYAPFITETHRARALQMMASRTQGAVHLMLGVAASRIMSSDHLRYCPECVKNQYLEFGEYFWQRNWFLPGLPACPEHGSLIVLSDKSSSHRHYFSALYPNQEKNFISSSVDLELLRLAKSANTILNLSPASSPSFEQWTCFYRNLASDLGLSRGQHIKHVEIHERVNSCFQSSTLSQLNLYSNWATKSCWLTAIFRKHRKSFSYLEHLVVWQTFLSSLQPAEIIEQVQGIKISSQVFFEESLSPESDNENLQTKKQIWQDLVFQHGVLNARKLAPGKAVYAWLYRNDKYWLLEFNAAHKKQRTNPKVKADWRGRDLMTIRQLRRLIKKNTTTTESPRLTANYLLKQLPQSNSIAKNLEKLPLTQMFLQRYTETVAKYQIRRISNVLHELQQKGEPRKMWIILRKAGLSTERLTAEANTILNGLDLC